MAYTPDEGRFNGLGNTKVFTKRDTAPTKYNKFYLTQDSGGLSKSMDRSGSSIYPYKGSVLPNCTGYANGRFNEIIQELQGTLNNPKPFAYQFGGQGNAEVWWTSVAKKFGLKRGSTPMPGAILCFEGIGTGDKGYAGHVAIVEAVDKDGNITTSESGYSYGKSDGLLKTKTRYKNKNYISGSYEKTYYRFQGFIYNPMISEGDYGAGSIKDPNIDNVFAADYSNEYQGGPRSESSIVYDTKDVEVTRQKKLTAQYEGSLDRVKSTNLLSYPSLVETPYIVLNVGGITFGTRYNKETTKLGYKIDYPNFMDSIEITKVNNSVNTYTISMTYQIEAGDDPNLLDKIFSRVGYGTIKISYGDLSSPQFLFRDEEALITKLTSAVDFSSSRIRYTLECTSTALNLLTSTTRQKAHHNTKPSKVIKEILYNSDVSESILNIFYGMKNQMRVDSFGLIASDDQAVDIEAKPNIDVISYLNYLVTCMVPAGDDPNSPLKSASYFFTIHDDVFTDNGQDEVLGGPYFTITKVDSKTKTLATKNTYEIDVGFPGDNQITSFNIRDTNSWALLYNYAGAIPSQKYTYELDNEGHIVTISSPSIATSFDRNKMTNEQKDWWTKMTQFPITAEMTIKGLLKPVMLMTYIRVNALFYGQRHTASGLYVVTKQKDSVSGNGYKTTLSLTRIGGDEDYLTTVTETVQVKTPRLVTTLYDDKGNAKTTDEIKDDFFNDPLALMHIGQNNSSVLNLWPKNNNTDLKDFSKDVQDQSLYVTGPTITGSGRSF